MTFEDLLDLLTKIVAIATGVRIALHWLRQGLEIWIPAGSSFWPIYDKIELTAGYVAGSLAAWGKKRPESQPSAPVTEAQSPVEGKIK